MGCLFWEVRGSGREGEISAVYSCNFCDPVLLKPDRAMLSMVLKHSVLEFLIVSVVNMVFY